MRRTCMISGLVCQMDIVPDPATVFVGMPFDPACDPAYTEGIVPALRAAGLVPWRADEQPGTAAVLCKICRAIQTAGLAIVDITGANPNVLFELGLLLGLNKRVVLLKERTSPVPTDLNGLEIVEYANSGELADRLAECLPRLIRQMHEESVYLLDTSLNRDGEDHSTGDPFTIPAAAAQITSRTRWTNLPPGLHLITYTALRPDGQLQPLADNSMLFSVQAPTDIVTAVYDLAVADNPPGLFPGDWKLSIFLNDVLYDTKGFRVTP